MMDEEVDVFLEHHGVKGQKWGVRKIRSAVNTANKNATRSVSIIEKKDKERYDARKAAGKFALTNNQKYGLVLAGIGGLMAANVILQHRGNVKIRKAFGSSATKEGSSAVKALMSQRKGIRIRDIPKAPGAPIPNIRMTRALARPTTISKAKAAGKAMPDLRLARTVQNLKDAKKVWRV